MLQKHPFFMTIYELFRLDGSKKNVSSNLFVKHDTSPRAFKWSSQRLHMH